MTELTTQKDLSTNLIVQSNDLLVSVCNMTLKEKLVFLACISQVDSRKTLEEGKRFVLSVEQAKSLFYTEKNKMHAYRDLKLVAERLFERSAIVKLDNNQVLKTRFVQSVIFDDSTNSISLLFADDIKPYISQLEKNFTKYKLVQIQQISNKNSVRLFELCTMWLGQCDRPYLVKMLELNEIREQLGQTGKYKQFGELKKMLSSAVKQLNESTDITVKIAYKKTRSSFTHLQLKITKVEPVQLQQLKQAGNKKNDNDMVSILTPFSMTDKQRQYYGRKLADIHELSCRAKGPSEHCYNAFGVQIANELLQEQNRQFYKPYLLKLGFSF